MVSLFHYLKLYFLLAGWSVRLVKNCDRRLVNAAFALRPRAAFSSLRSRFFTLRTDPEPFLSAVNWLTSGFACATLSLNRLTRRLQNRLNSNYFMLFAFSSTVNFSKIFFSGVKFRAKFEVLCTTYKYNYCRSLRITRSQTFSTAN